MKRLLKTVKKFIILLVAVGAIIADYGFLNKSEGDLAKVTRKSPRFYSDSCQNWADSVLAEMSLKEKVGQLFMIAAYSNKSETHFQSVEKLITDYHIGGLIFFQGGPVRQAKLTNRFQAKSKIPLMIGIDGEWGLGMRLDSTISFPRQMMLGAIREEYLLYEMGKEIARECKRIGVHVNFAPVIDVNNNPRNPVINSRSFGENKFNVASKGIQYMLGMEQNGLLTTGKHFPGHGDTDTDSHYALPLIKHDRNRLDSLELYPFRQLFMQGMSGIMVAHLSIPQLDSTLNRASTLSPQIVDTLLKQKMNFEGLIFTDALNMKGVSKYYQPGEADLLALIAGNDVLLFPGDVPTAVAKIVESVKSGRLDESVINNRVQKILMAKRWLNLQTEPKIEIDNIINDLNTDSAYLLDRKLREASLTLLTNNNNLLPLKRLDTLQMASLSIGNGSSTEFQKYLNLYLEHDSYALSKNASAEQQQAVLQKLMPYKQIIIGIHNTSNYPSRKYGITDATVSFIEKLYAQNKEIILVYFGNPYGLEYFNKIKPDALLICYSGDDLTQQISAQSLFGGIEISGRLPVSVGAYNEGDGKVTFQSRIKYTMPLEAGMDANVLAKIDSIAEKGIKEKAFPGCQVYVARNNMVVFNKSYGYQSESNTQLLSDKDLFDLASITKVAASTASLMKLIDDRKFKLRKKLKSYLPELDTTDKGDLTFKDILTHQAQLTAWIPFYLLFIKDYENEEVKLTSKYYSRTFPYKLDRYSYLKYNHSYPDSMFSTTADTIFNRKVADKLYMNKAWVDSIYSRITASELREKKEYKYSDLGYYYIYRVIEKITGEKLQDYTDENFYLKLGAKRLTYLPLEKFDAKEIAPTEDEKIFRKQLLRGYVHDPGAALLGGVCGHAGLFGNANDLGKMAHLFMNYGTYGGEFFISRKLIEDFTDCPFCKDGNRRGVGFDKPPTDPNHVRSVAASATPKSYGHSGFTGTLMWIDPEYDLIYIFLSNRIHPTSHNKKIYSLDIRPSIHELLYQSIIDNNKKQE